MKKKALLCTIDIMTQKGGFMKIYRYPPQLGLVAIVAIFLAACVPQAGGVVKGAVYGDLNANDVIDEGETVLDGAEVTLTDCGPTQMQITGADGLFEFDNLPAGTCHVTVARTGWIYSGSYPSLTYPVPVASDPDLPTAFSLFMQPVAIPTPVESPTPAPSAMPTITSTPTTPPSGTDTPTLVPAIAMVTPKDQDANCRAGPGVDYLSVGALKVGDNVPIKATITGRSWWQIQNPEDLPGNYCWVSNSVTTTSGSIFSVPVIPIPTGVVIEVTVSVNPGSVVHGYCQSPNAVNFEVSITTNGPATVTYHLEIYNNDGSLRNSTSNASLTFNNASTKTFDPGGSYSTDCGKYYIKAIVSSPNHISAQANWSVVSP
jgi:SH3-like domain-containing protein